jgi:hypothetical protein
LRTDGLFRPPPAQDDIKYVKAEELISKITVDSLPASYYFPIVLFDWLKALTTQSHSNIPPASTHIRFPPRTDGNCDAQSIGAMDRWGDRCGLFGMQVVLDMRQAAARLARQQ